jgi:catechol 2,3-dioxygenase-like lactoylglutathione lyase family enzyme
MQVRRLDHVNVRTANLAGMTQWYERVLGLRSGQRPPFRFPGAWLYAGDHPAVHLVGVAEPPEGKDPRVEHFAFQATGLEAFLECLKRDGERHDTRIVPGYGTVQVDVWDPDGNHIHIDFAPEEASGVVGGR